MRAVQKISQYGSTFKLYPRDSVVGNTASYSAYWNRGTITCSSIWVCMGRGTGQYYKHFLNILNLHLA